MKTFRLLGKQEWRPYVVTSSGSAQWSHLWFSDGTSTCVCGRGSVYSENDNYPELKGL